MGELIFQLSTPHPLIFSRKLNLQSFVIKIDIYISEIFENPQDDNEHIFFSFSVELIKPVLQVQYRNTDSIE